MEILSCFLQETVCRCHAPFDYSRRLVSTLVTDKTGECQLIMKGNISKIVSRCSHVEYRGEIHPIEKDGMLSVASVVDEMLQDGMKAIAVARKKRNRSIRRSGLRIIFWTTAISR